MPIARATVASRQNCAHPAGSAPLISNPSVNPAISRSSAASAQITCLGNPPARLSSEAEAPEPEAEAETQRPIQVLKATPTMYPAIDVVVWVASDTEARAT